MLLSSLQLSSADHASLASSLLSNDIVSADSAPAIPTTLQLSSTDHANMASSLISDNLGVASMDSQSESKSSISGDDEEPAAPAITTTTSIAPTTIIDPTDGYADADAALAFGSILNVHKGVYFNVPLAPTDGITVYYVTRGRKIGVFSGW
jgi:hypothetical protein